MTTTVRDFGAHGDGRTDDTAAISHAVQQEGGQLFFPRGDYRISRPIYIPLAQVGRLSIAGQGGTAKLLMEGHGPALHIVGSHRRSANPADFVADVWRQERFPLIQDLEIEGRHPEADGIRLEGVMQPTLQCLLIRRCRNGVHLTTRDRNVLITDCHIYDCSGVGIFLDRLNLHQINITGNHISYCQRGGIVIAGSEIRNLQICGNDIEYNHDLKAETSADILFDCREGTVREGTIVGNTIQAVASPGGANVRLLGSAEHPNAVGLFAITGNLIGSQETVLHLQACRGVVVSGNCLYSGRQFAIRAEDAEHLVIGPNSNDHNPQYKGASTDRILLQNCRNVTVTGLVQQHTLLAEGEPSASFEVAGCRNISITGCQIVNARQRGIWLRQSEIVRVADCTIHGRAEDATYRAAVEVTADCRHVMIVNNILGKGSVADWIMPKDVGAASGNMLI
ncbi:MAG: right-handed parallel beta-helix repeat-containing protein [Gemmataceae bacterium]